MAKAINFFIGAFKYLLPLVLVAWCAVLLMQKIDLTTADLGRHIKNGEIVLNGAWEDKLAVLKTNFYSFTEPKHEFVNHHWLSGVVFYLVHQLAGFKGLSVFYIALVSLAFYLFFRIAQKQAGSSIAPILAVLALPIITSRAEIRPEGFTYLFMALFFWLLWHCHQPLPNPLQTWRGKIIWLLPLAMILWVNLHIGFIFGFLILGAFWLEELIKDLRFKIKDKSYRVFDYRSQLLGAIIFLCIIAGLINPFGIHGLLYPLNIFREYGYMIVENQSVAFLQKLGMGTSLYFGLFKFLLLFSLLSFIMRFIKAAVSRSSVLDSGSLKRQAGEAGMTGRGLKEFPYGNFLLLSASGVLAFLAIRNFPVFGLLFLPIVAMNLKAIIPEPKHLAYKILPALVAGAVVIFGSFRFWENYENKAAGFGLGLKPGVSESAEFFSREKIQGPVFNNYDIGGYLIYHTLNSREPAEAADVNADKTIFVDNRPEAYSKDFLQKVYIPAQNSNTNWQELNSQYNFNAIFFSHRDFTPWAQSFLIARVNDPLWAPVFADQYNIILVRKNAQNAELISKFLLPPENFQVISN